MIWVLRMILMRRRMRFDDALYVLNVGWLLERRMLS